jgi:hypothetical protein
MSSDRKLSLHHPSRLTIDGGSVNSGFSHDRADYVGPPEDTRSIEPSSPSISTAPTSGQCMAPSSINSGESLGHPGFQRSPASTASESTRFDSPVQARTDSGVPPAVAPPAAPHTKHNDIVVVLKCKGCELRGHHGPCFVNISDYDGLDAVRHAPHGSIPDFDALSRLPRTDPSFQTEARNPGKRVLRHILPLPPGKWDGYGSDEKGRPYERYLFEGEIISTSNLVS